MAGMMRLRRLTTTLMKPVVIILVLGLVVGLFYYIPRFGDVNTLTLYKGPSARVNKVTLSDRDFNEAYLRFTQQYGTFIGEDQIKLSTMDYLIAKELVNQEIKKRKIKVSDQEVDDLLAEIKLYNQIDSEEELEYLIYQTGAGSLKGLKAMIREILAEQKLYTVLAKEAQMEVDEAEIIDRYEELEPAHILIATSSEVKAEPLSDQEALKKAREIYQKLQEGADFAELAREYSDDASNKEQGGKLGRVPLSYFKMAFASEFVEAALKLEVGEYSEPVKTQFGYHLITVHDKKLAQGAAYEREKEKIRDELLAEKFSAEKKSDWVKEQRTKHAKIEILDPYLLGYSLGQEGKWAEAAMAYEKALKDKRYKNELKTYLALAGAYKEREEYDAALGVFARLPKGLQGNFQVDLEKAALYLAKGEQEKVKAVLTAAEAKAGDNLGNLYQVLEKYKEAELTAEAEALEAKIAELREKIQKEQEELNRRLEEEQKKLEAERNQEGIIETPAE
ncbi:peptidylprolyl isomerase [Hydrogenispora sp. UU3]|uniref:Peptidylprolyl isomerase n=2 Tax=Capillibacterium thermochitinicola TaxID=2699427 RepID=A0A8J6HSX8_9FIRM|nr:peptidylprolyl isomerase [Capillibacterium thermochitinicola]